MVRWVDRLVIAVYSLTRPRPSTSSTPSVRTVRDFAITGELATYLLETYDQSPQLRRYFTNSFAPSETFAHTVAFNSRFADSCILTKGPVEKLEQLTPLTYIEYGQKIKILTENDYNSIMASGKMICRKTVTGESDQLMDMIDKQRQHG